MDRKSLIIVGSLVLLLIFYFDILEYFGLYKPAPPQEVSQTTEQVDTSNNIPQTQTDSQITPQANAINEFGQAESADIQVQVAEALPNDTIIVETNKYIVTLTTLGGGPISMLLKDYDYRNDTLIEMIPHPKKVTPEISFAGGTFSTSDIFFTSSLNSGNYNITSGQFDLEYTYQNSEGGTIKKILTFYPDSYHYDMKLEVLNPEKLGFSGRYNLNWNTPLGVTEPQANIDYEAMQAAAMLGGSREQLDDFDNGILKQSLDGYTQWAGVRSKYFAAIFIPKSRDAEGVFARGSEQQIKIDNESVTKREITAGINMPFATSFVDSFQVYVGPLDYSSLADYDVNLEDMLDIGTTPVIGWLIKPFAIAIIWLLPFIYKFIPNYGLVIILFALFVKVVTLPLSMKSFKSMNAMKELQPKIDALKKKHEKNPQALNTEMMKMYKANGVNPISGCLPMLPQMPLFFAMFSVFRSTILLRDAPFVWFIEDLSRGASSYTDPYIILVLIMMASQFISQQLTMQPTQQNKAFLYIMPIFMGWAFHSFASGLVLYWACFSAFSLLDYLVFKRKSNKNPQVS